MTNGEKIQQMFPNAEIGYGLRGVVAVTFIHKTIFDLDWWNAEYKEPTTKNDLALIHTEGLDEGIRCAMCTNSIKSDRGCDGSCVVNNAMYKEVMDVIENHIADTDKMIEPTTKNDLEIVMDAMEYKTNSLIENIKSEIFHFANFHCSGDVINIYDVFKVIDDCCEAENLTTKNDLGVDCISRADAIKAMQDKAKKLKNEDTINGLCGAVAILFNLPSVTPQEPRCKNCKWWKDSDGEYRRGCGAESQCPINRREVFEGNGYCFLFEPQGSEE